MLLSSRLVAIKEVATMVVATMASRRAIVKGSKESGRRRRWWLGERWMVRVRLERVASGRWMDEWCCGFGEGIVG